MDDRKPYIYKTTDFGATWKKITGNIPTGHPLDYVLSLVREPEQAGACSSPAPAARSTTRWTTAATWTQFKDGPAAGAGQLDHRRAALPRRRRLDLRTRPLHPAQHHAARADRAAGSAADRPRKLYEPAPIFRQARSAFHADRTSALHACARHRAVRRRSRWRSSTPAASRSGRDRSSAHQGLNGVNWDLRYDGAEARRAEDDAAGKPAHLGGAAVPGRGHPPRSRTGGSRRRPAFRWRRPASTRCASPSTAQRYTQPFEVIEGSGGRRVGRRSATSRRRRRCAIRDDITETSDDGQPDGGLAEADRRSGEGERGERRRSSRR